MLRWFDLLDVTLRWIGRLYGLVFLAIGLLMLYWGGRGLLAYEAGIRAAWTEPLACAAGLLAGLLSLWAGTRVVRSGIPPRWFPRGRGISEELDATLEEAMKLERTDPAASRQLLDSYFMREAAATENRRAELRHRALHDIRAAVELRRELQDDLDSNALARKDLLKGMPPEQHAPMLTQIDEVDRELQSQLLQLNGTIERLRLQ